MAIAPIDLQTLFTQLDKVGKTHLSQREGQPLAQVIQGIQIQKKTEEQINQVNEAQNTGDGAEKINDHGHRQHEGSDGGKKHKKENDRPEQGATSVLTDPSLGKNIDISL